ncbi:MAG: hypothetical protein HFH13_10005 [Dorea sp.]|nr:hypothetical protein [Dorea sp.]
MEAVRIKLSIQSRRKEIVDFLNQIHTILKEDTFDINTEFVFIQKKKKNREFSTPYTMVDLEYDIEDVVERLRELTVGEYSETLVDKDDINPPLLFVFGKNINNKQVYVKLKIKGEINRRVLCVSFHYAEKVMSFPYQ